MNTLSEKYRTRTEKIKAIYAVHLGVARFGHAHVELLGNLHGLGMITLTLITGTSAKFCVFSLK